MYVLVYSLSNWGVWGGLICPFTWSHLEFIRIHLCAVTVYGKLAWNLTCCPSPYHCYLTWSPSSSTWLPHTHNSTFYWVLVQLLQANTEPSPHWPSPAFSETKVALPLVRYNFFKSEPCCDWCKLSSWRHCWFDQWEKVTKWPRCTKSQERRGLKWEVS